MRELRRNRVYNENYYRVDEALFKGLDKDLLRKIDLQELKKYIESIKTIEDKGKNNENKVENPKGYPLYDSVYTGFNKSLGALVIEYHGYVSVDTSESDPIICLYEATVTIGLNEFIVSVEGFNSVRHKIAGLWTDSAFDEVKDVKDVRQIFNYIETIVLDTIREGLKNKKNLNVSTVKPVARPYKNAAEDYVKVGKLSNSKFVTKIPQEKFDNLLNKNTVKNAIAKFVLDNKLASKTEADAMKLKIINDDKHIQCSADLTCSGKPITFGVDYNKFNGEPMLFVDNNNNNKKDDIIVKRDIKLRLWPIDKLLTKFRSDIVEGIKNWQGK